MDVPQEVLTRLDKVAEKLGQGVDHFYPRMVEYQVHIGWIGMLVSLTAVVMAVILCTKLYHAAIQAHTTCKEGAGFYGGDWLFAAYLTAVIGTILSLLGIGIGLGYGLHILNPEYYTLMEIIRAL